ncbi:hypothetical protein GCM10020295_12540 [Streptomyces cinereospinus]
MRDAPAAQADEMAYGRPGAAPVVAVDVHGAVVVAAPARPSAEHGRDAGALDQGGQGVVEVQGEHQHAVHMAAGEVPADAGVVVAALGQQQHELVVVGRQLLADAAQLEGEEGVGEDPRLRLGDDDGDGVVASGHQAAGRLVGDVPEFLDGPPHPLGQRLAHPVAAVDHPRDGGP